MQIRILVVDDEPEIVDALVRYFTLEGYGIEGVTSPLEALKKIETGSFNIVISDIVMPEMSGVDLLKRIKQVSGITQVIMITGYVTAQNIISCFSRGANECLFKPLKMEELRKAVDATITRIERWHNIIDELNALKESGEG